MWNVLLDWIGNPYTRPNNHSVNIISVHIYLLSKNLYLLDICGFVFRSCFFLQTFHVTQALLPLAASLEENGL